MSKDNNNVDYSMGYAFIALLLCVFAPDLQAVWPSENLKWFREHLALFIIAPIVGGVALAIVHWLCLAWKAITRRLKGSAPVSCF